MLSEARDLAEVGGEVDAGEDNAVVIVAVDVDGDVAICIEVAGIVVESVLSVVGNDTDVYVYIGYVAFPSPPQVCIRKGGEAVIGVSPHPKIGAAAFAVDVGVDGVVAETEVISVLLPVAQEALDCIVYGC
jgi:hypothetical protein